MMGPDDDVGCFLSPQHGGKSLLQRMAEKLMKSDEAKELRSLVYSLQEVGRSRKPDVVGPVNVGGFALGKWMESAGI